MNNIQQNRKSGPQCELVCVIEPPSLAEKQKPTLSNFSKNQQRRDSALRFSEAESSSSLIENQQANSSQPQLLLSSENPDQLSKMVQKQIKQLDERNLQLSPVPYEIIRENICTLPECCADGKPHRHTIQECKSHPYCISQPIVEEIPVQARVPQPIPSLIQYQDKKFLEGVQQDKYGETGPQRPGTQTVPTQYSLDHYLAQQWCLDVENMPTTLPPELLTVQKKFASYARRSDRKNVKASQKPTFKKKLSQWRRAQSEMKQIQLEILFWQRNQDPKVLALLEAAAEEKNKGKNQRSASTGCHKFGRGTSPDKFVLPSPRDMIPIVYPTTMEVTPVIHQLNKEHEEILRSQKAHPHASLSELTEMYYGRRDKLERDAFNNRSRLGPRREDDRESHMPSKIVQARMDSKHLNSWMERGQIQEVAERYIQFKEMLGNLSAEQIEMLKAMSSGQQPQQQPSTLQANNQGMGPSAQVKNRNTRSAVVARANLNSDGSSKGQYSNFQMSNTALRSNKQLQRVVSSNSRDESPTQQSKANLKGSQYASSQLTGRAQSTHASTAVLQPRNQHQSKPSPRLARLFSAKLPGSDFASANQTLESPRGYVGDSDKLHCQSVPKILEETQSQNAIEIGSMRFSLPRGSEQSTYHGSDVKLSSRRHGGGAAETIYRGETPPRMKSFTIIVSGKTSEKRTKQHRKVPELPLSGDLVLLEDDLQENSEMQKSKIGDVEFQSRRTARDGTRNGRGPRVFNDLVEEQHKGKTMGHSVTNITRVFRSAHWQKEKDHLINSMHQHMTRHRPKVTSTGAIVIKREEYKSERRLGSVQLQQRLSNKLAVKGLSSVKMPNYCEKMLLEVPTLLKDKHIQDKKARQQRLNQSNLCMKAALDQKANSLSQVNIEKSKFGSSSGAKTREIPLKSTTAKSYISKSNYQTLNVPEDAKPDIQGITASRIMTVKTSFIRKVAANQKKHIAASEELKIATRQKIVIQAQQNSLGMTINQASDKNQKRQNSNTNNNASDHVADTSSAVVSSLRKTLIRLEVTEPETPGIGGPAVGAELKRFTDLILFDLNNQFNEEPVKNIFVSQLIMPEIKWNPLKLNNKIQDMDSVEFWQQQGLQMSKMDRYDAAIDFYRQGLMKHPTSQNLIYSLAVSYCKLQKYKSSAQWFSYGVNLHPRWVDGLCGIAMANLNIFNFEKAKQYITLAKENNKGANMEKTSLSQEFIQMIQAICFKMTLDSDKASKCYQQLDDRFKSNIAKYLKRLLWGLILIPLSRERKVVADHMSYLKDYLDHVADVPLPKMTNQNLFLSKFCIGAEKNVHNRTGKLNFQDYSKPAGKLDFAKYPKSITTLINSKHFLKRFNNLRTAEHRNEFMNIIKNAEVELYNKDQPIFLKNRVGIVMMGSVELRCHDGKSILKPYYIKKAIEGDVLGFAEGDRNTSSNPLTWLIPMQQSTEVIFFTKQEFDHLWAMQKKFTEQQIVLQILEQNPYFNGMNLLTKYHLVYEIVELKTFFPGQLIMSVHQRSPLCIEYIDMYKDSSSKFRREIDMNILKQMGDQKINKHALDKNNQTIYTQLVINLNNGNQSKEMKQRQSLLIEAKPQSERDTIWQDKFDKENRESITGSQLSLTAISQQELLVEKQKYQVNSDSEDSSESDYGVSHAKKIINERPVSKLGDHLNKSTDQKLSEVDSDEQLDDRSRSDDERDQTVSFTVDTKVQAKLLKTFSSIEKSKSQLPKSSKLRNIGTFELMNFGKKKKTTSYKVQKKKVEPMRMSKFSNPEAFLQREIDIRQERKSVTSKSMYCKMPELSDKAATSYKFILQKQINIIQGNNIEEKREHNRQKRQIKCLLQHAQSLQQLVNDSSNNEHDGIKDDMDFFSKSLAIRKNKSLVPELNVPNMKQQSSLGNTLRIQEVNNVIEAIQERLPNEANTTMQLYQNLVEAIKRNDKRRGQRREPTGVHFIESGEVLVIGQKMVPNMRLKKCDGFGLCDIIKKAGPEYLGDIRAGIKQVQTFYFPYEQLKKRLSLTEKLLLKSLDFQDERFEGVLNFTSSNEGVPLEDLRRF